MSTNDPLLWLGSLQVRVMRVCLCCDRPVRYSISMIRGVWGRALHQLDPTAYDLVFEGKGPPSLKQPLYLIRPDLVSETDSRYVCFEWIVWDAAAMVHFDSLEKAWHLAGTMGLGENRTTFTVTDISARYGQKNEPLSLAEIVELYEKNQGPCRLVFPHSLRLLRHGKLLRSPTLPDIIEAVFFRLSPFLAESVADRPRTLWPSFAEAFLALSTFTPSEPWTGENVILERYSGRQKMEVRQASIIGSLELPQGPSILWPLLAAASVMHIGKGTVMGLGRLVCESL